MGIYAKTQVVVNGVMISALKSDSPLHAGPHESRAEILLKPVEDSVWPDPSWVGHPARCGDVARWMGDCLKRGASIEEIDTYLCEHPEI